jgi:hypothetical protein
MAYVAAAAPGRAAPALARATSRIFRDPWSSFIQIVDYRDIQFTKTPEVLRAQGLDGLEKSESALEELRVRGIG